MTPAVRNIILGKPGPSLDLNFLAGALDPRVTFTRAAGPATYFDSAGVLQTAGTNVPRFDTDPATLAPRGLLIEEARTNIILQSADIANAAWTKGGNVVAAPTVTANQATAPDGTLVAAKIVYPAAVGATARSIVAQSPTATVAAYAFTIWLKGNAGGEVLYLMATPDAITWHRQQVTLTTTWQRFTLQTTNLSAATWYFQIGCDLRDAGQSGTAAQTIFAWGGQLELGAFPTSYIPTTTAAATRAADVATMPVGFVFPATIAIDAMLPQLVGGNGNAQLLFDDGTSANLLILRTTTTNVTASYVAATVATATAASGVAATVNTPFRYGVIATTTGLTISQSGSVPVTNAGASPAAGSMTTMRLGQNSSGTVTADGYLRRVRYWPRALSASELQAATR